jgi:ABC-2 type transport system permease protein
MASNSNLQVAGDRGNLRGFGNLFRKENHQWWGTWQWVIQIVIWLAIVNGMMAMVALAAPKIEAAQAAGKIAEAEAATAREATGQTALMVFFIFSGLAMSTGVVIIGQDAVIQERQSGTAAWILSKPVARPAFLLSKLAADALGILACMVLVQGGVAYAIYRLGTGKLLPVAGFMAGLGLVYLVLMFYLALTLMLGTLFRSRGPVIGISLILVYGNQLAAISKAIGKVMPWNLVMDLGPDRPSLALLLAQGQPLPTVLPIISTVIWILCFTLVAILRFQREEF